MNTKLILAGIFIAASLFCFAQNEQKTVIRKDKRGNIQSVEFSSTDRSVALPVSADDFFRNMLKIQVNDRFEKEQKESEDREFKNEHFDQYYKDVKVEGGGYNFHYKNGEMFFAHGEYISIGELSTKPVITPKEAETIFADYKKIPLEFVKDCQTELIIKEISLENDTVPMLVYRVRLIADYPDNDEIGIIDAQTGKVLTTEPAYMDVAATGTFVTRYSGTQTGVTHYYNGAYHLADSTSGRAVIHTWNLNGSEYISDRVELSDNDNNWTQAEHSTNYNDMALDVHWALQQIRNYLFSVHGKNGFNNSSTPAPIEAYVNDGYKQGETARWNPYDKVLGFGHGFIKSNPLASLDIVAHEFGHGIAHAQMNWWTSTELNEGLSDIWAAIMEYRIRPNEVWKIAEQVMKNGKTCLRNFQNTNDSGADTPIADTYGTTQYNNGNQYVRGGVFSHWFYLLVNGGSGKNGLGNSYAVQGIGWDKAENLIVNAVFNDFLDNTSSYEAVCTNMINAAKSMYNCGPEHQAVIDAWYAVGVEQPYTPSTPAIIGPTFLCFNTSREYTVDNKPSHIPITWTCSSNLSLICASGNSATFMSNNPQPTSATMTASFSGISVSKTILVNNYPSTLSQISVSAYTNTLYDITPPATDGIANYNWVLASSPSPSGVTMYYTSGPTNKIQFSQPGTYVIYAFGVSYCNTTAAPTYIYTYNVTSKPPGYSIYPNPAGDVLNIEQEETVSREATTDKINTEESSQKTGQSTELDIRLYDLSGNMVLQEKVKSGNKIQLNVARLPNGNYYLYIYDGVSETPQTQQIIVKH